MFILYLNIYSDVNQIICWHLIMLKYLELFSLNYKGLQVKLNVFWRSLLFNHAIQNTINGSKKAFFEYINIFLLTYLFISFTYKFN